MAGEAQSHFIDHGAHAVSGKHRQLVIGALANLRNTSQGIACLVLHALHGGNLLRHLDDQVHAHIALRLHDQRQLRGLADGLVVFDHGLVVGLFRRQRDDGIGAVLRGVFGISDGLIDVAFLVLYSDHQRRLAALTRSEDRFGAIHSLFLGQGRPAARNLRPGETVNLETVAEFDFVLQAFQIQLVGLSDRRLADGKDAAHWFRPSGVTAARKRQTQGAAAQCPQKFPPGGSLRMIHHRFLSFRP